MDALNLLANDHHSIGVLFDSYAAARVLSEKQQLAVRMIHEQSAHASVEEGIVFRMSRDRSPTLRAHIDAARRAHREIARTLFRLEQLLVTAPGAEAEERLDQIIATLLEQSRAHLDDDTRTLFAAMRRSLSDAELESMGLLMVYARPTARKRPPHAPVVP